MLRFRGSKKHTNFQTYERFYFLLWCVPSPCSCPLSNSTSYSTKTLVIVGAVLQQLTKTITISVRWIVDYLPFVLLDMDSFTKNHKRLTIMTFLVVFDNLTDTPLCSYSELPKRMSVLRFHITYNQFSVFPKYEVWFIAMTANHQSFIVPNLCFELFRHKHIKGFEYAEFYLSMNTRNSFISKKNSVIQIFFPTVVFSSVTSQILVLHYPNHC